MEPVGIGRLVKHLRLSRRLTQSQLVDGLGLNTSTLSLFENEERGLQDDLFVKLCIRLEIAPSVVVAQGTLTRCQELDNLEERIRRDLDRPAFGRGAVRPQLSVPELNANIDRLAAVVKDIAGSLLVSLARPSPLELLAANFPDDIAHGAAAGTGKRRRVGHRKARRSDD